MRELSFKESVKQNLRGAYDIVRAIHHGRAESKARKIFEAENQVVHEADVAVNAPLSKIYVSPSFERINLVFKNFDEKTLAKTEIAEFLTLAIALADAKKYALRIISRNSLPNPKLFTDFVKVNNLTFSKPLSFYTDSAERLSGFATRLEVTDEDVFFFENEIRKLKDWSRNGK